jgi:hypothetical protein
MTKPLRTSASAIETADPKHDGCYRKWFLQNVLKLPQLPRESTTFGTVLHSVVERYLLADMNGTIKGKPVELYPVGWEQPLDRYGKREKLAISLEEQALAKSLIEKAIAEGILMRVEGRQIEKEFNNWEFMEGVTAKGFIDLLEPGAIRDHKTTKDMKWAKSVSPDASEYLGDNIQMMFYAYWYYTKGGYDQSKPLTLAHQYYVKNPQKPHVEKREVTTTWEKVEQFMNERIAPVVEMMLVYRDTKNIDDIPLPSCPASACRKYGGCPFARICTNLETVDGYTERINRELTGVNSTDYKQLALELTKEGDKTMESPMQKKIREMREKQTGATSAPSPAPAVEAPKAVTAPAPVAPAPAADRQAAPWHFQGCKACADSPILGTNSQGTACRICDIMCKKTGVKTSSDFKWKVEAGKLVVMDGTEVVLESPTNEEPTAKEVVEAKPEPKKAAKVKPTPAPVVEPEPVVTEQEYVVEEPAERAPFEDCDITTERDRFTILIGCAVVESKVKGGGKYGSPACRVTAEELMIVVETEMIRLLGAAKWSGMNTFEKRDAVTLMSEQIANSLGGSTLTVTRLPKSTLLETVVMGIRPYAKEVIQAVAE